MGRMGRALARRLLDTGHRVAVWNRTPGRAEDLIRAGAIEAPTPEVASANAEVVFSVLTDDAAVAAVLGDQAPRLPGTAAVVDASTVSPETTARLASLYEGRFAACPVLGAPSALAAGQATLLVAGPPSLLERLAPLLESISPELRRCGDDPAAALVAKLLGNYLLLGGLALVSEAVVAGQAAGMSDPALRDLLGALAAPNLRNRLDDLIAGPHEGWFPTSMGSKDAHLFTDLARSRGRHLPVAELVAQLYAEAAAGELAEADVAGIVEVVRHRAG
jgi:3-hydroxyisobutyrate dehydrogenase-like beta-hydroxyacid dehydrogenase